MQQPEISIHPLIGGLPFRVYTELITVSIQLLYYSHTKPKPLFTIHYLLDNFFNSLLTATFKIKSQQFFTFYFYCYPTL